jgi:hypothetical protein
MGGLITKQNRPESLLVFWGDSVSPDVLCTVDWLDFTNTLFFNYNHQDLFLSPRFQRPMPGVVGAGRAFGRNAIASRAFPDSESLQLNIASITAQVAMALPAVVNAPYFV